MNPKHTKDRHFFTIRFHLPLYTCPTELENPDKELGRRSPPPLPLPPTTPHQNNLVRIWQKEYLFLSPFFTGRGKIALSHKATTSVEHINQVLGFYEQMKLSQVRYILLTPVPLLSSVHWPMRHDFSVLCRHGSTVANWLARGFLQMTWNRLRWWLKTNFTWKRQPCMRKRRIEDRGYKWCLEWLVCCCSTEAYTWAVYKASVLALQRHERYTQT
jgi:hypothetical protein